MQTRILLALIAWLGACQPPPGDRPDTVDAGGASDEPDAGTDVGCPDLTQCRRDGFWSQPIALPGADNQFEWPYHAALLPTGEVVMFGRDGGTSTRLFDPGSDLAYLAPYTGPHDGDGNHVNVGCGGHSFLPDGRLLVAGGWNNFRPDEGDVGGHPHAALFDGATRSWELIADMPGPGRWYPTSLTLADGRVLVVRGWDEQEAVNEQAVIYDPIAGQWELYLELLDGPLSQIYPYMHVLPDGILLSGGQEMARLLDIDSKQSVHLAASAGDRLDGNSVLLPPRYGVAALIGGGDSMAPLATTEILRGTMPQVAWESWPSQSAGRHHPNTIILPDMSLLTIGGAAHGSVFYEVAEPVRWTERLDLENPAAGWAKGASQRFARGYHSFALLLPDGRVLSGGGDWGYPADVDAHGYSGSYLELYSPPYLFRGSRPVIEEAPAVGTYGQAIDIDFAAPGVTCDAGPAIVEAILVRPSATTHSNDMSQRAVPLAIEVSGDCAGGTRRGRLTAFLPASGSEAPPGYYMLFLLDGDRVPSEATWIRLDL